ncbi:hypothetical protein A0256_17835 [Mucilaginibacter sp. PAMC 26640]|nr:hypothetical protein A0256_17835 [Mucilaginibacter sp. PAMC 26640]
MSYFRDFAMIKTNQLSISRKGWFNPCFELTDGQFVYGKLSHSGTFKRTVRIETADGYWTLKRGSLFSRVMDLRRNEDERSGTLSPEIWKNKIVLKMANGFEAEFIRKKLLSSSHTWDAGLYGELLQIKLKPFSFKTPYVVTINTDNTKSEKSGIPPLPLLTLMGVSIIIHRQKEAAALGI